DPGPSPTARASSTPNPLPAWRLAIIARQLALRAMIANRQAGRGFGVLEFVLDGYGDWIQRRDRAFADGLFVSLLDDLVRGESALVCGMRTGGRATLFLQSLTQAQLGVVAQGWSRRAQAMSFASRGGPDRLTVSMGAAHLEGYRSTDAPCQLEDLEFAARRGARLVGRTGGSQFALIERFGGAPPESIGLAPSQVHAEPDRSLDTASKADGAPSPQPVQPKAVPAPTPEELERTLAARYGEAFARLLEGRDLEWERRVQLLEKRLEKLGLMVDSAARAAMQPAADTGVASRFQTVQGLTQDDELFESKQGLMSAIYQANLEIRQRLKGRSVG
ncbi:MAG TPA: hypothetical protein P5218_14300, partial [Planctomycetota bacterium]|nr:hypothetical protein [Planctomycetota bacterium]